MPSKDFGYLSGKTGVPVERLRELFKQPGAPTGFRLTQWRAFLLKVGEVVRPEGLLPGKCAYDDAVDRGAITYVEAEKRERVRAAIIENERAQRQLMPRQEYDEGLQRMVEAFIEGLAAIPDGVADLIPSEDRKAARDAWEAWTHKLRADLVAAHGAGDL